MLTNTEMREVRESREFVGACAVLFVVDVQEPLNHEVKKKILYLKRVACD